MRLRIILVLAAIILAMAVVAWILAFRPGGGEGVLVDKRFEELVSGVEEGLRVSVEGLKENGFFEEAYTCDGEDRAPRVSVEGVPGQAKAVALVMYDPDAPIGTFTHWLSIAPARESLTFPGDARVEGRNDFGRIGYGGPCPPRGHGVHRYFFLVLALDRDPGLGRGFTLDQLLESIKGHIVSYGYTVGKYER